MERYDGLDGLRAYAILGIVMMHILANGNYALDGFIFARMIPSFTDFVFLFMTVSAFSMCCGYYKRISRNEITVDQFYSRRFAKMWPFFALLCFIDFIHEPGLNTLCEVFANLTLCFGLLPHAGNIEVIGVGWFLGVVFVFYFMFPFFCWLLHSEKKMWLTMVVALIFNIACAGYFGIERWNILFSAPYFVLGGMIYLHREQLADCSKQHKIAAYTAILVSVVAYYECNGGVIATLAFCLSVMIVSLNSGGGYSAII